MEYITNGSGLISISMLVPIATTILIVFLPEKFTKPIAFIGSLITFLISLYTLKFLDFSHLSNIYLYENYSIIKELGISYAVGVDGLSEVFYILSTFISFLAIAWSVKDIQIKNRLKEYYSMFLLTTTFLIGVFTAWDLILFYIFYELTLVPMIFVIGVWGYKLRLYSAYKFFIYIFISSLFLLFGIMILSADSFKQTGHFSAFYPTLIHLHLPLNEQIFLFLLFFIAFAVKTPLVPFHTWLPDAHGEAPTAGSVVLAAILLKMGSYAFLRFNIGLFPDASKDLWLVMVFIGILTIIYASWMTIAQNNIKRFVAYSSVSHMGFIVAAMFMLNFQGFRASVLEMVAHGFSSASLFMIAGFIYNRLHSFNTRTIAGSVRYMPIFSILVALTGFSAMGLPGGSSFWGKFLTIVSAKEHSLDLALIVIVSAFFSAIYMLYFLRNLFLEGKTEGSFLIFTDIRGIKLTVMLSLVVLMFTIGLFPFLFFNIFDASISNILHIVGMVKR